MGKLMQANETVIIDDYALFLTLAVTPDLMYYRISKQLALRRFIAEICINLLFFFCLTRQKGVSVCYKQHFFSRVRTISRLPGLNQY